MSSELSPPPSSVSLVPTARSSSPAPPIPIPAPRHTYGRRKPRSPSPDRDAISTTSLFFTAAPAGPASTSYKASRADASPQSGLLSRFSAGQNNFLTAMEDLLPSPTKAAAAPAEIAKGRGRDLGVAPAEDDEIDEEELRRFTADMSRLARAKQLNPDGNIESTTSRFQCIDLPPPTTDAAPRKIPLGFSSSTLTVLSTSSPLRSSPPLLPTDLIAIVPLSENRSAAAGTVDEDETIPIRKAGVSAPKASGRRRIVTSSSDEDGEGALVNKDEMITANPRKARTISRKMARSISPSPTSDARAASPSSSPAIATGTRRKARALRSSLSPSPASSTSSSPASGRIDDRPVIKSVEEAYEYMRAIKDIMEDDSAYEGGKAKEAMVSTSEKPIIEWSEDEADDKSGVNGRTSTKGTAKALAVKDQVEMRKDMARAARDKFVAPIRADAERLPMSAFIMSASDLLKNLDKRKPALVHNHSSPPTSPAQITPTDDIVGWTPSSTDPLKQPKMRAQMSKTSMEPSSSPTPIVLGANRSLHPPRAMVPASSEVLDADAEEPVQIDILEMLDEGIAQREAEERKQALLAKKLAWLAAQVPKPKSKSEAAPRAKAQIKTFGHISEDDEEEDELSIIPPPPKGPSKNQPVPQLVMAEHKPTASSSKATLVRRATLAAPTKNQQLVSVLSGKHRHAENTILTETMAAFAGKDFKHAENRFLNGGAVPAGQKAGRDKKIRPEVMDEYTLQLHRAQAAKLRKQKEDDFGRSRQLPMRQDGDWDGLVEVAKKAEKEPLKWAEDEDDEEEEQGEDGDWQPSGESEGEDEHEPAVEVQYSGDEGDVEDAEEPTSGPGDEPEPVIDKENIPIVPEARLGKPAILLGGDDDDNGDEDDLSPIAKRKPRISRRRVAFDSDDETETPRPRAPLGDVQLPALVVENVDSTPKNLTSTFVDLAGFGTGGAGGDGSPGFSQLFEATQANTGNAVAEDAFAALRAPEFGLLGARALLPEVNVSKTQAQRDNALIAAEVDAAQEERLWEPSPPKQQYMNDRGLFTQTKPAIATYHSDEEEDDRTSRLAGSSIILDRERKLSTSDHDLDLDLDADAHSLSTTEKGLSDAPLSPTQASGSPLFRRLKRRSSRRLSAAGSEEEEADDEGEEPDIQAQAQAISSSPPAAPRDALSRLMANAARVAARDARRKNKSAMVDEQAEESDDDGWLVPNGQGGEDDEDGDDTGYIEELVNDEAVDEEEKKKQDALAAEKNREIQLADDARREAEAKRITEGQYRTKRRGQDFLSDEEGDDDGLGGKRGSKAWRKKMRMKRKLDGPDGLDKLDGEENVFKKAYENELESDLESVDEPPSPVAPGLKKTLIESPEKFSGREAFDLLRHRARINKEKDNDSLEADLDKEIGFGQSGFWEKGDDPNLPGEDTDQEMEEEEDSQFSIMRSSRVAVAITTSVEGLVQTSRFGTSRSTVLRSVESYQAYVRDESQLTRRVGAVGAASVVVPSASTSAGGGAARSGGGGGRGSGVGVGGRPPPVPLRAGTGSSTSSGGGSILLSKNNRFQ